MTKRDEVRELRATITALSGKVPASFKLDYLRRRLAMLTPATDVKVGDGGGATAGSLHRPTIDSIGKQRAQLVTELSIRRGVTAADIINRALDEYAVREGYGAVVASIQRRKD